MDLLTTGVNVPCVRNIVFFRYIRSPILFHQIVGRGTRVEGEKLMFRILDYTGATALFGADFVTPPPGGGGGTDGPKPPGPPPVKVKGTQIDLGHAGDFFLMNRDGQTVRATPQEYRARLVEELLATVPTLAGFRERWLDPEQRHELLEQLAEQGLLPENLRTAAQMDDYDLFDVIAAVAYGIKPKTRAERAGSSIDTSPLLVPRSSPDQKSVKTAVCGILNCRETGLSLQLNRNTLVFPPTLAEPTENE